MPLRDVPAERTRGAPMNNKHKGHRQSKNKAAFAARRKSRVRETNRDSRMARIIKGLRGSFKVEKSKDDERVLMIVRAE